MTCTFFGHKDAPQEIQSVLRSVLKDLIENKNVSLFYVGNQGAFDFLVRKTLRELKAEYPFIRYAIVLAYMPPGKASLSCDDSSETIYPEEFAEIHPKYAIVKRNRWMIDKSDYVVTYVTHISGGAVQFKKLAQQKNKSVIDINDLLI